MNIVPEYLEPLPPLISTKYSFDKKKEEKYYFKITLLTTATPNKKFI
ncbi:MAG: hypothetical protein ACJA08_002546 [Cyclobacteriaceae bacterium]|jgi:hypothetical protein